MCPTMLNSHIRKYGPTMLNSRVRKYGPAAGYVAAMLNSRVRKYGPAARYVSDNVEQSYQEILLYAACCTDLFMRLEPCTPFLVI